MPFWTAILVRTHAWLVILQRQGVVNEALIGLGLIDEPLKLAHNFTGTIIGMVHIMLPFLILPLYASVRSIDGDLMRAASSMGASPARAFRDVFLPQSMPGLIAGTLLVFILAAFLTVCTATPLGTVAAYAIHRSQSRFLRAIHVTLLLPQMVPLILIGIGLFYIYIQLGIVNTMIGIVLAHTLLATPFVVVTVLSGLQTFDKIEPTIAAISSMLIIVSASSVGAPEHKNAARRSGWRRFGMVAGACYPVDVTHCGRTV